MKNFAQSSQSAWGLPIPRPRIRFPFIDEFRHYSWEKLKHDLLAGATLTLVSIPQAIGFAVILGLPPITVVLSVVVGGFVSALFFSSYHHVFGPTLHTPTQNPAGVLITGYHSAHDFYTGTPAVKSQSLADSEILAKCAVEIWFQPFN
jgi:hypothetical protein